MNGPEKLDETVFLYYNYLYQSVESNRPTTNFPGIANLNTVK